MSRRPVIGVSTAARLTPAWPFLWLSVRLAGGRPRRITPDSAPGREDGIDGLIVGGGDDIGAEIWGGRPVMDTRIDPARDRVEQALLARFWDSEIPILGICRGAQMMNVVRGGSLHPDIHAVFAEAPKMWTPLPKKRVHLAPGSRLARICGKGLLVVNSLHHQSVDRTGRGIAVSARDEAGIVQAIEHTGRRFRLGVQWHPEFLPYARAQRRLMAALVRAARRARQQREAPSPCEPPPAALPA